MNEQTMISIDPEIEETPAPAETAEAAETAEQLLSRLMARVAELEAELAARAALSERMIRECEEFEQYFPEVSLGALPEEVWTKVQSGVPLAAAYALYERGRADRQSAAQAQAAQNAATAAGLPGKAAQGWFSPTQVRAMSRREVRDNYDRIIESMKHWQ